MDKIFGTIMKVFSFTPEPEATSATLGTEKRSSSREVAVLRRRISALEREKELREGAAQEQKQKMNRLLDETMRINNELSKTRKKKKTDGTPTRRLSWFAAKKGLQVEYKFLEPLNFEYERIMRFMKKKEMVGTYRVQLSVAGKEFYGNAELPQDAKHIAAGQALEIFTAGGAMMGTAAAATENSGAEGAATENSEVEGADTEVAAAETSEASASTSGVSTPTSGASASTPTSAACGSGRGCEKNVNMALNEIAMRMGCELKWTLESESGPPHHKVDNGLFWC